jgi:hypothetical protein
MQAMIRTIPPQAGQVSMSLLNTRFRVWIEGVGAL